MTLMKTVSCTLFALIAFAGNSVLCRMALGDRTIDPSSFTVVRLLSGIVMLMIVLKFTARTKRSFANGSWISAFMLFLYAIAFSFAYISLDTGTGALVLFGAVQMTMVFISFMRGNRMHISEWVGILIAVTGFVYLVLPSVTTPTFLGFVLMSAAGIAWGIYTLHGRTSMDPLRDTAFNFVRTTPFIIALVLLAIPSIHLSAEGVMLAVFAGGIASGIGYTVWYVALGGLSTTEAAVVQLSVPVIAAVGGLVFLSEAMTVRSVLAAVMILGGILTVVLGRWYVLQLRTEERT